MYHVQNLDLVPRDAIDHPVRPDDELTQLVALKLRHPSATLGKELQPVGCGEYRSHEIRRSTGRIFCDSASDVFNLIERGIRPRYGSHLASRRLASSCGISFSG